MKLNSVFIDLRNPEHVKWWNNVACKLVKVIHYSYIEETATGKKVGVIIKIGGVLKNVIIKRNEKFLVNPITTVFKGRL